MGKTIHIIALILSNRPKGCGPTLIVCPASVGLQWELELATKATKKAKLKVMVYKDLRRRDLKVIRAHDVVIVTYHTLMNASGIPPRIMQGEASRGLCQRGQGARSTAPDVMV